jgi:hypothetical protein
VAPAAAQLHIMVRDDTTAVLYKVNEPDGLTKVKEQAERIGGDWRVLLSDDQTCGGGAIWYASNGRERHYFVVKGRKTASEANVEAAGIARGFADGKQGWTAGALRTWYNKNAFARDSGGWVKAAEKTVGVDRCQPGMSRPGYTGVRG